MEDLTIMSAVSKVLQAVILIVMSIIPTNFCAAKAETAVQVYVNDPLTFDRPQSSTESDVGKALIKLLSEAKLSVDFALYGIRDQDAILESLIEAQKRGVKIRGIVDKDVTNQNYYTSTPALLQAFPDIRTDYEKDLYTLKNQKEFNWEPYCSRPEGFDGPLQCIGYSLSDEKCIVAAHASREPIEFKGDIMHDKFFIVDGEAVWTGSTNASDSGTGGYNANTAVVIKSKKIASWFTAEFEQMYVDGRYHRSKIKQSKGDLSVKLSDGSIVDVSFSPQGYSVERLLRPLIKGATDYIDVPVFFLTHKKLAGDLIHAHQRGVNVRVIIDATAAKNGYTKHEVLRIAGIPVKVENWGGKMHMKVAVIDGKYLVTGSMNWTSAGERNNDENTVVITSKVHAEAMHTFFNHLWESIPEKWLKSRPDPESLDSTTACFDGVDNDFDDLVDAEDPGCSSNPPALHDLPPSFIVQKRDGNNLIKGNISKGKGGMSKERKIYQIPGSKYYEKTKINVHEGERWFCSIYDARENGWKSYRDYK